MDRLHSRPIGIWWSRNWASDSSSLGEVAKELEDLGYGAFWLSAGFEPGIRTLFSRLLEATDSVVVASGILSVWPNEPGAIATAAAELGERFLLGIGASHAPLVESTGTRYERPLSKVTAFLDGLDAAGLGANRRILGALGPRMLALAAKRSLGAHPYFVPLEHTVRARQILGSGPLLVPEVAVVLSEDPSEARAVARQYMAGYLGLENYLRNLRELGWPEADLQSGGSDRLVDSLIPWGSAGQVAERVEGHLAAGADHVCLQVLRNGADSFPLEEYRQLAAALL